MSASYQVYEWKKLYNVANATVRTNLHVDALHRPIMFYNVQTMVDTISYVREEVNCNKYLSYLMPIQLVDERIRFRGDSPKCI